jgi:hypothetical protein
MYPELTNEQVIYVADCIKSHMAKVAASPVTMPVSTALSSI